MNLERLSLFVAVVFGCLCTIAWFNASLSSLHGFEEMSVPIPTGNTSINKSFGRHVFPSTRLDGSKEDCAAINRSLKFSDVCRDTEAEPLWPLLITSVGSSGTRYMTMLLQKLGFKVSHDGGVPGPDGAVSWVLAFNNKSHVYPRYVGLNFSERGRFQKVFLQVRDPLKVMNSRLTGGGLGEWFIDANTPVSRAKNVYSPTRALEHWVSWNMHVLRYSDWSYRLEDVDIGELCIQAGFGSRCPSLTEIEAAKATLPMTTHHHKRKEEAFTWEKLAEVAPLMTTLATDLGSLFGYNLSSGAFRTVKDGRRLLEDSTSMVEIRCVVDFCQVVQEY